MGKLNLPPGLFDEDVEPESVSASGHIDLGRAKERALRQELAASPKRRIHPLETYLFERGIGMKEGARLLCVAERRLRDVLAWERSFHGPREGAIAEDLGIARSELFPKRPSIQETLARVGGFSEEAERK